MQDLTVKKENVIKAAEKCPEAKPVLEELFPEAFSQAFVSGTWFFDIERYASETGLSNSTRLKTIEDLKTSTNLLHFSKYIYVLAHLKNAHEYGLFNMRTGYQWRREATYIRKQGVGVIIPGDHLQGLIKIRDGGGK